MTSVPAFVSPLSLGAARPGIAQTVNRHHARTPQLSISLPRQDTNKKPPRGKRVPTFRKMQTRHRVGPAAFRQSREAAQSSDPFSDATFETPLASPDAPDGFRGASGGKQGLETTRPQRNRQDATQLCDLSVGQHFVGTVRNLVRHGAFIDIGATRDGLAHIRDLSDEFVHDVTDVVRSGEKVDVWVKYVDPVRNVLALMLFRPKLGFEGRLPVSKVEVGSRHQGVVQRITNFGTFIDIGCERMGFVHTHSLWGSKPWDTLGSLKIGQDVHVSVEDVNEISSYIRLNARNAHGEKLSVHSEVGRPVMPKADGDHLEPRNNLAMQRFGQELAMNELVADDEEEGLTVEERSLHLDRGPFGADCESPLSKENFDEEMALNTLNTVSVDSLHFDYGAGEEESISKRKPVPEEGAPKAGLAEVLNHPLVPDLGATEDDEEPEEEEVVAFEEKMDDDELVEDDQDMEEDEDEDTFAELEEYETDEEDEDEGKEGDPDFEFATEMEELALSGETLKEIEHMFDDSTEFIGMEREDL